MANRSVHSLCFGILMFTIVVLGLSTASFAQYGYGAGPYGSGIVVSYGPPPLPVYDQPPLPDEGYIWAPGYWAYDYDYDDYYWVPGTWVLPPEQGYLWTPGYWGWSGNGYRFNEGYWAPEVGYYGGIDYGYGYYGEGYDGGRWENGRFYYNRRVNHFDRDDFRYVYDEQPRHPDRDDRVSYNGGQGGVNARPTRHEEEVAHERHIPRIAAQTQNIQAARTDPQLRASSNQGKPPVAAVAKPGDFHDRVVAAKQAGGTYNPPPNRKANRPSANADDRGNEQPERNPGARNTERPGNEVAPRPENSPDRPAAASRPEQPRERPAPPNVGNSNPDRDSQQQEQRENERQRMQQKPEQDHPQMQPPPKAGNEGNRDVEPKREQKPEPPPPPQKMEANQQPKPAAHPEPRPKNPDVEKPDEPH